MCVLLFVVLLFVCPPLAFIWLILRLFIALGRMGKK